MRCIIIFILFSYFLPSTFSYFTYGVSLPIVASILSFEFLIICLTFLNVFLRFDDTLKVRELGVALGIASESVWRHPFPGPGLAIR